MNEIDAFINPIDPMIFRQTNAPWNDLRLNDPWSVGYVSSLIVSWPFRNKEEWERFYYDSGEHRLKEIQTLPPSVRDELNDFTMILKDPQKVKYYSRSLKNYNLYKGRTETDLQLRGNILFQEAKHRTPHLAITPEIAAECVRYRTICETWNGIIIREKNAMNALSKKFRGCYFQKTHSEMDYSYAIDAEMYYHGIRVCALQIKPESYGWNAPYIVNARKANKRKNEEYIKKYLVPVFTVIARADGRIVNEDVLFQIQNQINQMGQAGKL